MFYPTMIYIQLSREVFLISHQSFVMNQMHMCLQCFCECMIVSPKKNHMMYVFLHIHKHNHMLSKSKCDFRKMTKSYQTKKKISAHLFQDPFV